MIERAKHDPFAEPVQLAANFFGHLRGSAFRRQAEMAFFHTPLESELSSGATRDRHPLDALLTTRGQQEDVRRMAGV